MEPKIRLKGFSGEWLETTFDSLAKIRRGLTYSPSNIIAKGIRVLRSSNINEDTFVTSEDDVFVEEECVNIPLANDGDILITAANGSPRLVGKHAVIKNNGSKMVPGGFMVLAMTDEPYFLNSCMSSPWYKKFLKIGVAGGNGAIGNLNKTALCDSVLFIPTNRVERDSIASYFQHLDSLIQSTTKKIESLKQVKAASLQSMFPQEGETVPRVRFKGFNGEWEKVFVGKMGTTYSGLSGKTKDDFVIGNARFITFLNVLSNAIIDTSILESVNVSEGEHQNEVRKGDLLFNTSSETPEEVGMCAVMDKDLKNVYLNSFCFGFRITDANIDSTFIAHLMRSHIGRRIMSILAQGATRYNLSKNSFCNTELLLPRTKEEQHQIANYFTSLDSQITLHTQRLKKLKQIKSACLDYMFV